MKSQALVIQFVVFFLIGLSIVFLASSVFNYFLNNFRSSNLQASLQVISNSFNIEAINAYSCSYCQQVDVYAELPNLTLGSAYKMYAANNFFVVESTIPTKSYNNSFNNLNESLNFQGSAYSTAKNVIFTINKTQNYIKVGWS